MARTKNISSLENEIAKITGDIVKLQKKQDALTEKLAFLQKQKQEYEAKQVMEAFKKSGKSFQELMTFLQV